MVKIVGIFNFLLSVGFEVFSIDSEWKYKNEQIRLVHRSKEPYPVGENNKDIINNNINKKIYNNEKGTNRKIQFEYEQRDYSNLDFSKFYANQVNTLA